MGSVRRLSGTQRDVSPLCIADLYDEHAAGLLRWFQARTFSSEIAADLCAETFASAIESQDSFDPERGAAGAWLWGIGRNLLRQFCNTASVEQRARRRLALQTPLVTDDDLDAVDGRLDAEHLAGALAEQVDALGPNVASAIRARVLEAKSYEVVAAECGCSVGAARVRVTRGLTALLDGMAPGNGSVPSNGSVPHNGSVQHDGSAPHDGVGTAAAGEGVTQ